MDTQQIIIGMLVLLSVIYIGRKILRTARGKSECASCKGGCSHSEEKDKDSSHHCCR